MANWNQDDEDEDGVLLENAQWIDPVLKDKYEPIPKTAEDFISEMTPEEKKQVGEYLKKKYHSPELEKKAENLAKEKLAPKTTTTQKPAVEPVKEVSGNKDDVQFNDVERQRTESGFAPKNRPLPSSMDDRVKMLLYRKLYAQDPRLLNSLRDEPIDAERHANMNTFLGQIANSASQIGTIHGKSAKTTLPEMMDKLSATRLASAKSALTGQDQEQKELDSTIKDYISSKYGIVGNQARGLIKDIIDPTDGKTYAYFIDGQTGTQHKLGLSANIPEQERKKLATDVDTLTKLIKASQDEERLKLDKEKPSKQEKPSKPDKQEVSRWKVDTSVEAPEGEVLERDQFGNTRMTKLPPGVKPKQSKLVHGEDINKQLQAYSKSIANLQDVANSLNMVEDSLGFKLDEYDEKTGKIAGKKTDLPGVSIPGVGRTSFYSADARVIQSTIQKVFNVELKDRSGAAVTNNEMERIKLEFAAGKFNSEEELIGALKRYRNALMREVKNREAAFDPAVVKKYGERGGQTSESLNPMPSKRPGHRLIRNSQGVVKQQLETFPVPQGWEEVK